MIFQTRSDGSTSVPTPAESVFLSLARSIRRENGDTSRRFPDPFPVLPSLLPSGAYCLSRLDTSFRIRFFLQSLAISTISTRNLSPPDTQTEESNGGGGGIETREEGEIGGRRRDTEAILSCHFCSHRRVIMSGTSKTLLDLADFVFPW